MSVTLLEQIKQANKQFLAGCPQFLDSSGDPFIVIACMDPRLTGLIEPALGLPRHRAIVIRTAGNLASETNSDLLRSVAAGIFLKGGKEILVAGHTDCALSKFPASEVIENFRKAGIPRSAFGDGDLRTWFGAFTDVKTNVLQSAANLRKSALIPRDVKIHGIVIEIEKGAVEVVLDGDAVPVETASPQVKHLETASPAPVTADEAASQALASNPQPAEAAKSARGPIVIVAPEKAPGAVRQPESMLDAAMVLRDFIARERRNARFERTLARIQMLLKTERDPVRIVTELNEIADGYKSKYPELPGALEYLQKSVRGKGSTGFGFKELLKRVLE